MRLSNLADYAVITMQAAASHCGGERTSASALADETGLPRPTVQKVVSKLTGAGLLRSIRGARGGLQLARPAAAITVADMVEAVEGPITLTSCVHDGACDHSYRCAMKPHWPVINTALRGALAGITLAQLNSPAPNAGPNTAPNTGASATRPAPTPSNPTTTVRETAA